MALMNMSNFFITLLEHRLRRFDTDFLNLKISKKTHNTNSISKNTKLNVFFIYTFPRPT